MCCLITIISMRLKIEQVNLLECIFTSRDETSVDQDLLAAVETSMSLDMSAFTCWWLLANYLNVLNYVERKGIFMVHCIYWGVPDTD